MRIDQIDLTTHVGAGLQLKDPFWIASCHLTSSEKVIAGWSDYPPGAITIKTCTREPIEENKQTIRLRLAPNIPRLGRSLYCDGPKQKEFMTYDRAATLLIAAQSALRETKVGISVLAGKTEDYVALRAACRSLAFCELNLKYAFRQTSKEGAGWLERAGTAFADVIAEIKKFCQAFADVTVLVKLPREMRWLPGTQECGEILGVLGSHGRGGLVVANSLKQDVPQFIDAKGEEQTLRGGVICGEHLFDDTLAFVHALREDCERLHIPIVATGGMIDEVNALMALRAGASAIQLCTVFDYYQTRYYRTMLTTLRARIYSQGLKSAREYIARLPQMGVAVIATIPFVYFDSFYSDAAQNTLLGEVRSSERMDVLVLSGYSLLTRWRDALRQRFERNLGMRLFLPNGNAAIYEGIQSSWGITQGAQLQARRERLEKTIELVKKLWTETSEKRAIARGNDAEAPVEIVRYDQCPFQSYYVFDGTLVCAPYPIVYEERFDSPAYAFYGKTVEYERVAADLGRVRMKAEGTGAIMPLSI